MVTRKAKVSTTLLHEFDIHAGVYKRSVKAMSIFGHGDDGTNLPLALMTLCC